MMMEISVKQSQLITNELPSDYDRWTQWYQPEVEDMYALLSSRLGDQTPPLEEFYYYLYFTSEKKPGFLNHRLLV